MLSSFFFSYNLQNHTIFIYLIENKCLPEESGKAFPITEANGIFCISLVGNSYNLLPIYWKVAEVEGHILITPC